MEKVAKHLFLFISIFLSIVNLSLAQQQGIPSGKETYKIVLDAGHGGDKPGALGKHSKEKDITLQVVLKLGQMISQYLPNTEVIYTRTNDVDVELYKRAQIANQKHADLFISIHCNSAKDRSVSGHETFAMGLAKSDANLAVAKKENADMLLEQNYELNYDGFNPNSIESHIMFSLYQNAYLEKSLDVASLIQKQYSKHRNSPNRGVKQAGFMVLFRSAMPAVLSEIGFISNLEEEKYMMSDPGQVEIAGAIVRALCEYQSRDLHIKNTPPSMEQIKKDYKNKYLKPVSTPTTPPEIVSKEEPVSQKGETSQHILEKPPKENTPTPSQPPTEPQKTVHGKEMPVFRIQILSGRNLLSYSDKQFKQAKDLWHYEQDGWFRYTAGKFSTRAACLQYLKELQDMGFQDAFMVVFIGDKRITLSEARQFLTEN